MKFLIGYDIAGNRARSRVAKYLEGKAYRIQYSVFLFDGTEEGRALFMAPMCEACSARIWKVGKMKEEAEVFIVA